jgi:hypothetical protein
MMNLWAVHLFAAFVFWPTVFHGQDRTSTPPALQQGGHSPQGFADFVLRKVNPNDKDYGALADAARDAVVEHSIDDLYFWSNVVTLTLLVGATTILFFHLRGADKKEVISASLIAQLWNGRVSDRIEIERRTEQYNSLVEQHNAEVEQALSPKSQAGPNEDREATDLKRSVENLDSRPRRVTLPAAAVSQNRPDVAASDTPVSAISALSHLQRTALLERRIEAMGNTEKNLKERLNQTSALLEQERQRNQALKGA